MTQAVRWIKSQLDVGYYYRLAKQRRHFRDLVACIPDDTIVVICGGMGRSGSTWQFNVAKMIFEQLGHDDIGAGWVDDLPVFADHKLVLVKIHQYDPALAARSDLVLTSYRDLRDVLASSQRCFNRPPSVASAKMSVWHFEQWRAIADHVLRYEDLLERGKPAVADEMIDAILAAGDEATRRPDVRSRFSGQQIADAVEALRPDRGRGDREQDQATNNGLYVNHITDGRQGSWQGQLPDEIVSGVESACGRWMRAHGYLSRHLPLYRREKTSIATSRAA
jgi:hypothetical protein